MLIGDNKQYFKAEKVFWHDKILAATFLKLFPRKVKPNHLTMFRFLATPFIVLIMVFDNYGIGLCVFLLVAFTDALDGSMARTRDEITVWGKIYDPLADKLLIGSMVFAIVLRYIDFLAAMVIIGAELIIISAAWWWYHKGHNIEANIWGKIKMVLQVFGTTFLLLAVILNLEALLPFGTGAFYLAIAFAIVSLLTHGI
ncbi:MAG: CDP-alcohol phosphatidyltransferase family protein [Patescibacteria group bacterium]|jgi:CDP-diacylglycerol--glycerol-3-phosphate 3-phosphatidyltransferase